jgi:hypothetical protein
MRKQAVVCREGDAGGSSHVGGLDIALIHKQAFTSINIEDELDNYAKQPENDASVRQPMLASLPSLAKRLFGQNSLQPDGQVISLDGRKSAPDIL